MILQLAFQSIGIVYGDIGTSPLYVYASTFSKGINHNDDILGVLSLIFYTLTLIPLIKYVLIVLRANDNGDGELRWIEICRAICLSFSVDFYSMLIRFKINLNLLLIIPFHSQTKHMFQ